MFFSSYFFASFRSSARRSVETNRCRQEAEEVTAEKPRLNSQPSQGESMSKRVCDKPHVGNVPAALGQLPESQANFWRHACAACAYELGQSDAQAEIARLRARITELEIQPKLRRKT